MSIKVGKGDRVGVLTLNQRARRVALERDNVYAGVRRGAEHPGPEPRVGEKHREEASPADAAWQEDGADRKQCCANHSRAERPQPVSVYRKSTCRAGTGAQQENELEPECDRQNPRRLAFQREEDPARAPHDAQGARREGERDPENGERVVLPEVDLKGTAQDCRGEEQADAAWRLPLRAEAREVVRCDRSGSLGGDVWDGGLHALWVLSATTLGLPLLGPLVTAPPGRSRGAVCVWCWLGLALDAAEYGSVRDHQKWRLAGIGRHWPPGEWVGLGARTFNPSGD